MHQLRNIFIINLQLYLVGKYLIIYEEIFEKLRVIIIAVKISKYKHFFRSLQTKYKNRNLIILIRLEINKLTIHG